MEKVKKHAGAKMTSQLRHNFQANQAVHGADDIRIIRARSIC